MPKNYNNNNSKNNNNNNNNDDDDDDDDDDNDNNKILSKNIPGIEDMKCCWRIWSCDNKYDIFIIEFYYILLFLFFHPRDLSRRYD